MRIKNYSIVVLLFSMSAFAGMAQNSSLAVPGHSDSTPSKDSLYAFASLAEKIYLQLDSRVYTTDQTIWFRAIVTDAVDHAPTKISGVLHVDLIDPNEQIVEKKLIKIKNGTGNGFFQLNQNYTAGHYQIRAYTEWNRNFESDFFFNEYLQIYATGTDIEPNPIANITVIEGQNNERRIKATFEPRTIDSLHSKDLTLFISFEEKKDTVSIKRTGKNYLLDYAVPGNSRFVTLQLETKNNAAYSKTILLDTHYLDLQFFPESGELVHGISSIVGFKSLNSSGKGEPVDGEILNSKKEVIASFKSNDIGMGLVALLDVDSTETYSARLHSQDGAQRTYPLPAVSSRGNVLAVRRIADKIHLKASSNYLHSDSISVRASCRGKAYFDFKGRLQNGNLQFSLPATMLPEGVIAFTLLTASMTPVAERLYFNERPGSRLQIALAADKEMYTQHEQTILAIATKDIEGRPVEADLSVMVVDGAQLASLRRMRENILSYFLVSSDLKGKIENPGVYFTDDRSRYNDLDALLLTQGWRKYKYSRPTGTLLFKPEHNLTVSGYVGGVLSQHKEKAGVGLTMMTFGESRGFQIGTTDSSGRFNFIIDEEVGQTLEVLIQSNNKSGKQKEYAVILDKKQSPAVSFDHIRTVEQPDSIVQAYVSKSRQNKEAEDAFIRSTEGIALQQVVIKEQALTPQRKLVEEKYGKPKVVIDGEAIRQKEQKWSYGLYSVLMFNFPDQVRVRNYGDMMYASLTGNNELTLVVIDGIPVMGYNYRLIPAIPPSEVKSFELIPYAKNFRSLFCEMAPEACGLNAPVVGNVIAIYTHAGNGIFGVKSPVGITTAAVPVFAVPREFYAPKYEQLKTDDWLKPDLRTLVHWQPKLITDSEGKAAVSFYNADNPGTMTVIVEAISANGEIGYKELSFNVRKRQP